MESRAYRRVGSDNSDGFSIASAAGRTASWSMLSGLSLSEISNINIVALPVYATDISNRELYSFGVPGQKETGPLDQTHAASPFTALKQKGLRRQKLAQQWRALRSLGSEADSAESKEQVQRVFGVALLTSIRYANIAIRVTDEHGKQYIFGYVPIIVAKCGVFIKEKGKAYVLPCHCDEIHLYIFTNNDRNRCRGHFCITRQSSSHSSPANHL